MVASTSSSGPPGAAAVVATQSAPISRRRQTLPSLSKSLNVEHSRK
jgi:hypothetical protein